MSNEKQKNEQSTEEFSKKSERHVIIIVVTAIILILIICLLPVIAFKADMNNTQNNNENSMSRVIKQKTNSHEEKFFNISDSEEGKIELQVIVNKGKINIEVTDEDDYSILNYDENATDLGSIHTVSIPKGNGIYTIKVDTIDFIGSYNITFDKKLIENIEEYKSDKGYSLKYDTEKFEITNTESGDKFVLSKDPNVYLLVNIVNEENKQKALEEIYKDKESGDLFLFNGKLEGKYLQKEETLDNGDEISSRICTAELENKNLLIIEERFYTNNTNKELNDEELREMINSITINLKEENLNNN